MIAPEIRPKTDTDTKAERRRDKAEEKREEPQGTRDPPEAESPRAVHRHRQHIQLLFAGILYGFCRTVKTICVICTDYPLEYL